MWISIVAHIYTQMGYKQTHRREGGKKSKWNMQWTLTSLANARTHKRRRLAHTDIDMLCFVWKLDSGPSVCKDIRVRRARRFVVFFSLLSIYSVWYYTTKSSSCMFCVHIFGESISLNSTELLIYCVYRCSRILIIVFSIILHILSVKKWEKSINCSSLTGKIAKELSENHSFC